MLYEVITGDDEGKEKLDPGPVTGGAGGRDFTAMGFDDVAGDVQAEAEATRRRIGSISPVVLFEHLPELLAAHPDPTVGNRKDHAILFQLGTDRHVTPLRGVLERVTDQVLDHLGDTHPVEADGMAVSNSHGIIRYIHDISNAQFRSKFENDKQKLHGNQGIGVISDSYNFV